MEYNGEKFEVWIGNLGKYNEAKLVGEWVELPVTKEDYQAVLKRIGISDEPDEDGNYYEETFYADYNNPFGFDLGLGEYGSIEYLNKLATGLEKAEDEHGTSVIEAMLEEGYDLETSIANAVENNCYCIEDVENEEDVGEYFVNELYGNLQDLSKETIESYFDYESFGRDLSFDNYEVDTDGEEKAYYDLKEAVECLKEEASKYTVKLVDENGEEVDSKSADDLDTVVSEVEVYKGGELIDTLDPSNYDMETLLEDVIIYNEKLDIGDTASYLDGYIDNYMSISVANDGKVVFATTFTNDDMPDVEYSDRDTKYVTAGEYWCGDSNATNAEIGEACVDALGMEGVNNKEYYFDYESFGRDCLDGDFSLTSVGLLSTIDVNTGLNLDDVLDEDEWKFDSDINPKYTADRAVSGETTTEKDGLLKENKKKGEEVL